jgi:3-hydroxymyristoyl/3-hydroxydecanoyl-(acyl carrier protein) dehydratase
MPKCPPDSPWFDGHFPEDPTLPGIAQLEMAVDAIRLAKNETYRLKNLEKSVLKG